MGIQRAVMSSGIYLREKMVRQGFLTCMGTARDINPQTLICHASAPFRLLAGQRST